MIDLGLLTYLLGILEVKQIHGGIFISKKNVNEILYRFRMQDSKPIPKPTVICLKLSKQDAIAVWIQPCINFCWMFDVFNRN